MYDVSIFNSCDDEFANKKTKDKKELKKITIELINEVQYLDVGDKIVISEV